MGSPPPITKHGPRSKMEKSRSTVIPSGAIPDPRVDLPTSRERLKGGKPMAKDLFEAKEEEVGSDSEEETSSSEEEQQEVGAYETLPDPETKESNEGEEGGDDEMVLPHMAFVASMQEVNAGAYLHKKRAEATAMAQDGAASASRSADSAGAGGATSAVPPSQDASKGVIGGRGSMEQSQGVSTTTKVRNINQRFLDAEQISKNEIRVAKPSWGLSVLDFYGHAEGRVLYPFFIVNFCNEKMPPVTEQGLGPYLRVMDPALKYSGGSDPTDTLMGLFDAHRNYKDDRGRRLPFAAVPIEACKWYPVMATIEEQQDEVLTEKWKATLMKQWDRFQRERVEDIEAVKAKKVTPKSLVGKHKRFRLRPIDGKASRRRDEVKMMAAQLEAAKEGERLGRRMMRDIGTVVRGETASERYTSMRAVPEDLVRHPEAKWVWVSVLPDCTADPSLIDPEERKKLRPFDDGVDRPLFRVYPFVFDDIKTASDKETMRTLIGDTVEDFDIRPWPLRDLKCLCRFERSQVRYTWRHDIQHGVMDELFYGEKEQVASYHEKCQDMGFNPQAVVVGKGGARQDLTGLPRRLRKILARRQKDMPIPLPERPVIEGKDTSLERAMARVSTFDPQKKRGVKGGLVSRSLMAKPKAEAWVKHEGTASGEEEEAEVTSSEKVEAKYRGMHPEATTAMVKAHEDLEDGRTRWRLEVVVDGMVIRDTLIT